MPGSVWTIVVAAGVGRRFGGPKQFEDLGGRRVLDWSVASAAQASDGVVVVVPPALVASCALPAGVCMVAGGESRSESVRRGLAAVPEHAAIVCVHDAARPFATVDLFTAVVRAVESGAAGAVPGVAVTDTIKLVDAARAVVATPDRASLVAVQTPQAFRVDVLRAAHAAAADGTDDAALVEAIGGRIVVVPGESWNRKLTEPEDLDWARARVAAEALR